MSVDRYDIIVSNVGTTTHIVTRTGAYMCFLTFCYKFWENIHKIRNIKGSGYYRRSFTLSHKIYKNSSGNEIANVNFYAVRPEATRIC